MNFIMRSLRLHLLCPGRSNFYCEDSGKYKNSTLLDSSKAVTIDKIPQISNLSAILGNSFSTILQNMHINRFHSSAGNLCKICNDDFI